MIKKIALIFMIINISFFAFSGQSQNKVAIVKLIKGDAEVLTVAGDKEKIKKNMWLTEGSIISTSDKSFVRLSFIDKSSMSIGPKSSLKIEKFSKNEAGIINVLTGQIRSKVTKDYLDMDKDKSKLFVKSKNAVMGVRGTDFLFTTNQRTGASSAVLFEGSIVFNKIAKNDNLANLENIVNRGRHISPGEVSVANRGKSKPTVPAKLNSKQFTKLFSNGDFEVTKDTNSKRFKSVVPPGLSGDLVSTDGANLKTEISKITKSTIETDTKAEVKNPQSKESRGFVEGDNIKPADGVMVHLDTGTIIPPGIDSSYDKNSGEWTSTSMGGAASNGEYLPPEGFKINDDGQLLKVDITTGKATEVVVIDIKPVDQMLPIDKAPTVKYVEPTNSIIEKGPKPAGIIDDIKQIKEEFNQMENNDNPDGVKVLEDGSTVSPDGTITKKDGTKILLDGTQITKDGIIVKTDGTTMSGDGKIINAILDKNGSIVGSNDGLQKIPMPSDCSTCNQPPSLFNSNTNQPAPTANKSRVRATFNK